MLHRTRGDVAGEDAVIEEVVEEGAAVVMEAVVAMDAAVIEDAGVAVQSQELA